MFNYSKLVSIALITALSTFLWSCSDDENSTPSTPTCNLKTATLGEGANVDVFSFTYNAQNQLTTLSDGRITGTFVNQPNRVLLNVPEVDIADTMNTQGNRWVNSFSNTEFENNDSTLVKTRTIATPTFVGSQITQLKIVSTETDIVNGTVNEVRKDSSLFTFTYNNKGNVTRIAQQGGESYEFTYADSTSNIKVNNYFMGVYFGEFFENGVFVPFLTGNFKLCNNPPSSSYSIARPNDRLFLKDIKADGNGNLSQVNLYEGTSLYDTYKFTYECK